MSQAEGRDSKQQSALACDRCAAISTAVAVVKWRLVGRRYWIMEDRTQVVTTFPDARSLSGLGVPAREDRRTAHTDGQIGCLGGVTLPT
jgi:hypothetical protein